MLVDVVRAPGFTTWRVRPMSDVLRERRYNVGKIEDALAQRLWSTT